MTVSLKNRMWVSGDELLKRWQIRVDELNVHICPNFEDHLPAYRIDSPGRSTEITNMDMWSNLTLNEDASNLIFATGQMLAFEKEKGFVIFGQDGQIVSEISTDGKERQKLGRLREEKKTWDRAIDAAVHAALSCQGKEIKRHELTDELHQFNLPDTTIERIWKALRDKGLTKKGGRPRKTNK